MHIWTISVFAPTPIDNNPAERFMGVAKAALAREHKITHFTTTFRHPKKKHRFNEDHIHREMSDYEIVFLHSMGYKKNMFPKRFVAHWDFANKLLKDINKREKPDIIFISMPPLSTGDKISTWGKRNNVPVVVDIIDPWPDSFIKDIPTTLKPLARKLLFPFYARLDRILKNSSALTAISKGYLEWARQYYTINKETQHFYPSTAFEEVQSDLKSLSQQVMRGDKLRIIYAGSLASSYDIPTILKAAEILNMKHPNKTEIALAGLGPQAKMVKEAQGRLPNVKYLGWLNKEELRKQYYLSDLGFIQHKNSLTQTVTYKLFSYLGAGLPVLNSLQSEMVDIIRDNKVGFNNKEGDAETLAANIEKFLLEPTLLQEYKQNALNLTSEQGDAQVVYDQLVDFLEKIVKDYK